MARKHLVDIYTQKMHEVQKYATITNHGYIGYIWS